MPQITLADFEARVLGRLDNNSALYPLASVDRLINEAARCTNLFTGFSQAPVTLGLTLANVMMYRVPQPIAIPMKVYLDGKEVSKQGLVGANQAFPKWLRGVYGRSTAMWIPIGTQMFALVPPDPLGGHILEVWGITTPALLVNPTDTLTLDDGESDLIERYAFINLCYKEGGKVFADASRGYQDWIKDARELQAWTAKINPRFWVERDSKGQSND